MASADYMASTSALLECSICMKHYSEVNLPRSLPCMHVYCTACLSKLARDHRGKRNIKCPECRKDHFISKVEKLKICLTTMKLREIKHTHQKQMEAERQKQRLDGSDSASTASGKTKSASQTSGSEIEEPLPSFMALMNRASQSMAEASHSGKLLELAINETQGRQDTLLKTMESAKQTIEDCMDRIVRAATERKQQLLEILEDAFQESMSPLTAMEKDFEARQESLQIFCSKMAQELAALQGHDQADPEKIDKLVKENQDSDDNFKDKILIPMKEFSLDTDEDRYENVLVDVSSWGEVKIEPIIHDVPPVHPQTQPSITAMTTHYLAKTKAMRTFGSRQGTDLNCPFCAAQLPNGYIAIGSYNSTQIRVCDSELNTNRVIALPSQKRPMSSQGITGMCVTPNGKLCISDPGMKTVHVVTPAGRLESSFNTCLPPLEYGFDPWGLASNKEGEVFVCDGDNHLIRVFDQSGQECRRFGGRDEEPGKLCNPCDLAVTPDGKVLVADTAYHRIQVFDGTTGSYQATFGSEGSGPNQLYRPVGIAIDSMGFVAVVEQGNHRVQLFTPHWESFHSIHSQGDPFKHPQGVIFTKCNEVVVCDYHNNRIQLF